MASSGEGDKAQGMGMSFRYAAAAVTYLVLSVGCRATPPVAAGANARVMTIVPGCPCEPDGTVSSCQWRRAAWAAALYHRGEASNFITSGGPAYTPHAEAEALRATMITLGVPPDRIVVEPNSLHTDQNVGFSLFLASELGYDAVAAASDGFHAEAMCSMAHRWGVPCRAFPLEPDVVQEILPTPRPRLQIEGLARDDWIAQHPEPRMATSSSYNSFGYYFKTWFRDLFRGSRPPVPRSVGR